MKNKKKPIFSENNIIMHDALMIIELYKGKVPKEFLKEHKYIKLDIDDIVICEDKDGFVDKLVVGFECWYSYPHFQEVIKVLRAFDVDDEDIDIYIPKEAYPMLITVDDEKIYMGIAPRLKGSDGNHPKFLIKEVQP